MTCENCKIAPATYHSTRIEGSESWERHLCGSCAKLLPVDDPIWLLVGVDPDEQGTSETTD